MEYRNGNYCAFYVREPFNASSLGAHATRDFCYYNILRAWKGKDSAFPFSDSHNKTYSVRDGSDWEKTLKPRLRKRLERSKNIILFLSSSTRNSKALKEEIDYGVNILGLPVIVIYPEYIDKKLLLTESRNSLNSSIKSLWEKLPIFKNSKSKVPVLHIPMDKTIIQSALNNSNFSISKKCKANDYFIK